MPLIIHSAPNLAGPLPALRKVSADRKNRQQRRWIRIAVLPQEALNHIEPGFLCRTHHGNRRSQFFGEFQNVERPAALGKNVRHIQEHESWQTQCNHRCG